MENRKLLKRKAKPTAEDEIEVSIRHRSSPQDQEASNSFTMDRTPKTRGQKVFLLLKLPPELWIQICKFAVEEKRPVWISTIGSKGTNTLQPPITRVCSAIRSGCLSHYYAANIFYVSHCGIFGNRVLIAIGSGMNAIGPTNRQALRRLNMKLDSGDYERYSGTKILVETSAGWRAQYGEVDNADMMRLKRSGFGYEGGEGTPVQRLEIVTLRRSSGRQSKRIAEEAQSSGRKKKMKVHA